MLLSLTDYKATLCGLTFELTATRAARRLGGVVQHKPACHDAQAACRVGSRLSEGLGRTPDAAKLEPRAFGRGLRAA
jgi:hypothetical protein